jgi:heme A synthase
MVSLALSTAITAARLGHAPPGAPPPLAFMALSLFIIVAALALVILALWNRRRSDWHKRLMLTSLFMMTGPGLGRIVIPLGLAAQEVTLGFLVTELLLAVAIWHDYLTGSRKTGPA